LLEIDDVVESNIQYPMYY